MAMGTKILVAAAALCLLLWFALMGLGVQPLTMDRGTEVIYGEGEDFYSDALVYRKQGNDRFLFLHLPRARPAYRWVSIDFRNTTLTLASPPHTLGSLRYLMKNDDQGTKIGAPGPAAGWYWHFTEQGAAFSGEGFSCKVRRAQRGQGR